MDNKQLGILEEISKMHVEIWQKGFKLSIKSFSQSSSLAFNDLKELNNFFFSNARKLQLDLLDGQTKINDYCKSKFLNQSSVNLYHPKERDSKFKDIAWQENIFFVYIKLSYLLLHDVFLKVLEESALNKHSKHRLKFTMNFIFAALAPTNFLLTNPEAMKETLSTQGTNLIKGYYNYIGDLQVSDKYLNIQTVDPKGFIVGKDLAKTKGKVIFKNNIFELIEYYPVTEHEYEIPLLIVPPCINKYYIFDLQEKNSLVLWLLKQGYKVFIISWNNPDLGSDFTFDSYVTSGVIKALELVKEISNIKRVNLLSYCIGGTLSLCAVALLKIRGEEYLNSLVLLASLVDFQEVGDMSYFINEETIDSICSYTRQNGGFTGNDMSLIFNILKPSETIWRNYINNYFLGNELGSFDILFWNADSTRIPRDMHEKYLREFYINNKFIKDGVIIDDTLVSISNLNYDLYIVATVDDHIVPWKSIFGALDKLKIKNQVEFTLADSGHVAGIINSPYANKYCYWKNSNIESGEADQWLESSSRISGSWWIDLNKWLAKKSGITNKSSISKLEEISHAPGNYVLQK